MTKFNAFDIRSSFAAAVCAALCTISLFVVVAAPVDAAIQTTQTAAVSTYLA